MLPPTDVIDCRIGPAYRMGIKMRGRITARKRALVLKPSVSMREGREGWSPRR